MPEERTRLVDSKARKILFDTYWASGGWREDSPRPTSREDLECAKRAGVMFDPVRLSHAEIVQRALKAAAAVNRRDVANAFVTSLASRELGLRSALGNFAALQHLRDHESPSDRAACCECGVYDRE